MSLSSLQEKFQSQILAPESKGADWIAHSANNLSSELRLGIYHNAYRVRLVDTLFDTFEHTADYITHDLFELMAYQYVEQHASTHTNIALYGQLFPAFLRKELANCDEVPEVAEMDWLLRRAFDGTDAEPLTQQSLQQMATSGMDITHLSTVADIDPLRPAF